MVDHSHSIFQTNKTRFDQRVHDSFVVLPGFRLFGLVDEDESIAEDVLGGLFDLFVCTATGCQQVLEFTLFEVRVFLLPVEAFVEIMQDLALVLDAFDYLLELVADLGLIG